VASATIIHLLESLEHHITTIVILLLLPLDILALILGRRERKQRLDHMARVEDAARVYSREAYEFLILRSTQGARDRILCYWHSLHATDLKPRYRSFNEQFVEARKRERDVRIITAKDTGRLPAALELIKGGVDVRFQETLLVSDLRFSLFDDVLTVFGLPESLQEMDTPSREGIDVTNRKLVGLLNAHFTEQWEKATSYDEYLESVVREVIADDSTNTVDMVAQQLRLPREEVQRHCGPKVPDEGP
jgi:hypothetical protein